MQSPRLLVIGDFNGREPSRARLERVGAERLPVLVIDNLLIDPTSLLRVAHEAVYLEPRVKSFPGIYAPAPLDYVEFLTEHLLPRLQVVFGLDGWHVVAASGEFSLITHPPDTLALPQRVPHSDGNSPGLLALLHYITPGDCFGTAFYRHRATGFERITVERREIYLEALNTELLITPTHGYLSGDTTLFEQTRAFDGRFNRLIVYQGFGLHCANVPPDFHFSADPHRGRLTVNTFFDLRPQGLSGDCQPKLTGR